MIFDTEGCKQSLDIIVKLIAPDSGRLLVLWQQALAFRKDYKTRDGDELQDKMVVLLELTDTIIYLCLSSLDLEISSNIKLKKKKEYQHNPH